MVGASPDRTEVLYASGGFRAVWTTSSLFRPVSASHVSFRKVVANRMRAGRHTSLVEQSRMLDRFAVSRIDCWRNRHRRCASWPRETIVSSRSQKAELHRGSPPSSHHCAVKMLVCMSNLLLILKSRHTGASLTKTMLRIIVSAISVKRDHILS